MHVTAVKAPFKERKKEKKKERERHSLFLLKKKKNSNQFPLVLPRKRAFANMKTSLGLDFQPSLPSPVLPKPAPW